MKRSRLRRTKGLKRTPLKRTELKPGKQRSWNSTLPPMSTKRKKLLYGECALIDIRREWLHGKRCYICRQRRARSVHEILGGSEFRHITERDPLFWVAVCDGFDAGCHAMIQSNLKVWPVARVLAHKLLAEGGTVDLVRFNEVVGGRHAVEMADVDYWLTEMEVRQ